MSQRIDLLTNGSATGSYFDVVGGRYIYAGEATWAGGSIKLQSKGPNGTAIDCPGVTLSANGFVECVVADGSQVRAAVTGSPTAAYISLVSVGA